MKLTIYMEAYCMWLVIWYDAVHKNVILPFSAISALHFNMFRIGCRNYGALGEQNLCSLSLPPPKKSKLVAILMELFLMIWLLWNNKQIAVTNDGIRALAVMVINTAVVWGGMKKATKTSVKSFPMPLQFLIVNLIHHTWCPLILSVTVDGDWWNILKLKEIIFVIFHVR